MIREYLSQPRIKENAADTPLAQAAKELLADYQSDNELTAFTSLDSEDFAMRRGDFWMINLDPTIGAEIRK